MFQEYINYAIKEQQLDRLRMDLLLKAMKVRLLLIVCLSVHPSVHLSVRHCVSQSGSQSISKAVRSSVRRSVRFSQSVIDSLSFRLTDL